MSDAGSPDAWAVSGPSLARRAAGPRRRVMIAVALAVAVLAAAALTTTLPATERFFVSVSDTVQSLMSIFVSFFAVLLAAGLLALGSGLVGIAFRATRRPSPLAPPKSIAGPPGR